MIENLTFMQIPVNAVCFYPPYYYWIYHGILNVVLFLSGLVVGVVLYKKRRG